jgi:DNA replication protein DnaC
MAKANGSHSKTTKKFTKSKVLVVDDLALAPMGSQERRDLLGFV